MTIDRYAVTKLVYQIQTNSFFQSLGIAADVKRATTCINILILIDCSRGVVNHEKPGLRCNDKDLPNPDPRKPTAS